MTLMEDLHKQITSLEEQIADAREVLGVLRDAGHNTTREENRLKDAESRLTRLRNAYDKKTANR